MYRSGSKELQASFCADFLEALGREQISFSALIILICKMSMKMFFLLKRTHTKVQRLRLKTEKLRLKIWKQEIPLSHLKHPIHSLYVYKLLLAIFECIPQNKLHFV